VFYFTLYDPIKYTLFDHVYVFHGSTIELGPRPTHFRGFSITHNPTDTTSRTPPDEWSARRRSRYSHNTKQTHIPKEIRNRDSSNQVASRLLLSSHGHRHRPLDNTSIYLVNLCCIICYVFRLLSSIHQGIVCKCINTKKSAAHASMCMYSTYVVYNIQWHQVQICLTLMYI
jgi:hypothetical protein